MPPIFGWTSRKRLVWTEAFFPPEWRPFASDSSFASKGWHTLAIPRRRRVLPALSSIFQSGFKPYLLTNRGSADHPEGRMPVITRLLDGQPPMGTRGPLTARVNVASRIATSSRIIGARRPPFFGRRVIKGPGLGVCQMSVKLSSLWACHLAIRACPLIPPAPPPKSPLKDGGA